MSYVPSLMKEIIGKRELIWDLGKADSRKRFADSYSGVVWTFIQPIVTVSIYTVIFGVDFKSPSSTEGFTYVEWLVLGIVPWLFFSESVNSTINRLQEYSYLVKKVVFKVEILPIIKLIFCLPIHAFFMVIMLGMHLTTGRTPLVTWFQLVYCPPTVSLLALGVGFFTSTVNVLFEDMTQTVSIRLQFGIWMTLITHHEAIFTGARKWVEVLFKLNPSYYVVAGYRDAMPTGDWFWERPALTLYYWGFTVVVLLPGLRMFECLRPHFSGVLQDGKERFMIQKVEISWRHGDREGATPVEVVCSKRHTIGLEIKTDGHVYARVPVRIPNQYMMDFIKERQEWIVQKWFMMVERRRQEEARSIKDYEKDPELEKLYRKKAKRQLENRCAYFAERMAVNYSRIAVRVAKTRQGSYSARGNPNFHWKLVLMPPEMLDYVVVHELTHRKEMNHPERFRVEMERILPDYRAWRKQLKEFGGQV